MISFLGKKIGMTSIYNKFGFFTPVTLIYVYNCYIFKILEILNSGLYFILSYFNIYSCLRNKNSFLKQFKVNNFDYSIFNIFDKIPLNVFYINQKINVFGISIGKGFSGVIKRYNFNSGSSTHGNSKSHNKPGSIGMCQDPGRVYPGKKMPGRLGGKKVFLKNLKILKIDFDYNIFYLNGNIPGYKESNILIIPTL